MRLRAMFVPFLAAGLVVTGCAGPGAPSRPAEPASPSVTVPAATQPALADRLNEVGQRLAGELAGRIPPEAKIAVLPLVDSEGGVRRIGVLLAEEIERSLVAAGRPVVDRAHLNALLDEIDLQQALAAEPSTLRKAAAVAQADVLVVGHTVDAGEEVLCSARALQVGASALLGQTPQQSLPRGPLGRLLWYVRRPGTGAAASQTAAELPPLALRYEFVSPGPSGEARLDERSAVRGGQQFRIRVQPNSDCFLYVLLYDSRGEPSVLFPRAEIGGSNEIRGGVTREFPAGSKWYYFDENPGAETFYLVASYTPLTDLDGILAQMRQAGGRDLAASARKEIDGAVSRGMSTTGAKDFSPKGYRILDRGVGVVDVGWGARDASQEIDDVVIGCATVVKKLTLQHQK